jgi:hypothetical protein
VKPEVYRVAEHYGLKVFVSPIHLWPCHATI